MGSVDENGYLGPLQRLLHEDPAFGHRNHLALGWTYLQMTDQATAEGWMRSAIRRVASMHGRPEKYHETLMIAWMRLVAHHVRMRKQTSFDEFIAHNAGLLDRRLPGNHYSRDLLQGTTARTTWVDPDLSPFPK